MELEDHKLLKKIAYKFLSNMGFDVETEVRVVTETITTIGWRKIRKEKKTFKVDAVGYSDDETIAIECGYTPASKLRILERFFDKIYVLEWDFSLYELHFNNPRSSKHKIADLSHLVESLQ